MVHFNKFVQTSTGKKIMSIILGFGLATLFRNACKDAKCITFIAAPMKSIKGKIFKHNTKCYKYEPMLSKCNNPNRLDNLNHIDNLGKNILEFE